MVKSLLNICLDNINLVPKGDISTLKSLCLPRKISRQIKIYEKLQLLSGYSQFIDRYKSFQKEDILISGSIQSGKTNELLFYCWWSIFVCRRKVVFVSRNITADKVQLLERLAIFNERFITDKSLYIRETTMESSKKGIICILANYKQVETIFFGIKGQNYNLCIDEADTCIKSRNGRSGFRLEDYLRLLEKHSKHQIGATATEFAVIGTKKTLTRVFQMVEPSNYYGIKRINVEKIQYVQGIGDSDEDPNIPRIYDSLFQSRNNFFILHSTSRLKSTHMKILNRLRRLYPYLTIVIFNGDCYTLKISQGTDINFMFRWVHAKQKKIIMFQDNHQPIMKISRKIKLCDILQELRNHKQKYISLISGRLASRGLSFVSRDYKLHLTDQYYIPSETSHGESLLQGIRLFGCYNDNPNLTLWTTKNNWKYIKEQYKILKRYIAGVKDKDNVIEELTKIKTISPLKKFSRNSVMKGVRQMATKDGYVQLSISETYDYNLEPVEDNE